MLTDTTLHHLTEHIAGQSHAMAGASMAAAGALACSLGEACVGISALHQESADEQARSRGAVARLTAIRCQLLALADEDGAAITAFAQLREAGQELKGQNRLCEMPVEMGQLASEAARLLQEFRPLVRNVQDDLEMAITLLRGVAQAATLLLDSNLRLWPEPNLLEAHEPALAQLRDEVARIEPKARIRP